MWCIFKYIVESPDGENQETTDATNKPSVDVGFEEILQTIKNEIDNHAENYIISLHYLDFPVVIHYGFSRLNTTKHLKILHEYLEPQKEVRKILLMDEADYVKGFYFLRKQIAVQQSILAARDMNTFDKRASESGLETYIINDLRTIWKNRRLEQLQHALAHHVETYYQPDYNHPLYTTFLRYLEDTYKRGVDRFKTFICIGSTFIGKSVFFSKFIVPEEYYIYHSNYLEYSKMPDQPNKIFRILDDINWDQVTSTELKSLMNRNISSVNIKYGYEYIFPLIPIIIMNGEDYKLFRQHFSDIWTFIERNAVIYPPQEGKEVKEERRPLFTTQLADFSTEEQYLFNTIISISKLKGCDMNNMNEWIKKELNATESWKYDTKRYIQLPDTKEIKIPNPELNRKTILKQYEEYILKKKVKEMNTPEKTEEKKPREPWYKQWKQPDQMGMKRTRPTRFDDLNLEDEDESEDSNEETGKKKYEDEDEETEDEEMSSSTENESDTDETMTTGPDYNKGFIQI